MVSEQLLMYNALTSPESYHSTIKYNLLKQFDVVNLGLLR